MTAERLGRAVVVLGWTAWLAGWFTGTGSAFSHDTLLQGGLRPGALAVSVVGWQVMIAAMMVPSSLPALRALDGASPFARLRRGGAFLGGYAATWSAFGIGAFLGDAALHAAADRIGLLASNPWTIPVGMVTVAVAVELAFVTRAHATAVSRTEPALAAGLRHGVDRVRRCWALMLLSFAFGMDSLIWMVLLTAMTLLETAPRGERSDGFTVPTGARRLRHLKLARRTETATDVRASA